MQGSSNRKRQIPAIDLATVREALAYIRDDLQRVPTLERAAEMLSTALAEIAAADRRQLASLPRSLIEARWLPRRRQ
jgi:hypothetical protein